MDDFERAVAEEAKRRGLKVTATCTFCGQIFLKQEMKYILEHADACQERIDLDGRNPDLC
jgi:hypothetical protein